MSNPPPLPLPPLPDRSGLKGMMPGILEMLQRVATGKGINYEEWFEGLKHKGQVGACPLRAGPGVEVKPREARMG